MTNFVNCNKNYEMALVFTSLLANQRIKPLHKCAFKNKTLMYLSNNVGQSRIYSGIQFLGHLKSIYLNLVSKAKMYRHWPSEFDASVR